MTSFGAVSASTYDLVPFNGSSNQGGGLASSRVSVSATGRYVMFLSTSTSLVPNDTAFRDVFVLDTETGAISKESGVDGMPTSGHYEDAVMTHNGRYILVSLSNDYGKLYLRDRALSQSSVITIPHSGMSYPMGVSEDGRFVFYNSGGSLQYQDVDSGTETSIPGAGSSTQIDCSGRFAVTATTAQLVPEDQDAVQDVYLIDVMNGMTYKNLTLAADGTSFSPSISCDGNYVTFASNATNLVSGDTNGEYDIYQYSVGSDEYVRVSLAPDGSEYGDYYSTSGGVSWGVESHTRPWMVDMQVLLLRRAP